MVVDGEPIGGGVTIMENPTSVDEFEDKVSNTTVRMGFKQPRPRSWSDPGSIFRVRFLKGMEI